MNRTVMMVYTGAWEGGLSASYRRAMESLGVRVVQFDLEAKRKGEAPLGKIGQRAMSHLDFFALNAKANRKLVTAAMDVKPAAVIVVGVEAVRPATLLQLKISVPGVKLVNIFPDMLFNVRDAMFPCLPLYDRFCCHTRAGLPWLREAGCKGAFYLPLAVDPTLHRIEEITPADARTFGSDLVYVGNYRPEHEALFRALEGMDLAVWGSVRWKNAEGWVRSRWRGRPLLDSVEYSKAHRAAKICLNPIDPLDIPGHNQRTFEVPACGGFPVVTRTEEVLEIYDEGESVVCFASAEELVDKIRHYLPRPEERRRIAENAHERVIEGGHTYRDRVRTLFREIELEKMLDS